MPPRTSKPSKTPEQSTAGKEFSDTDQDQGPTNLITVDNQTYNTDTIPDEIKELLRDLIRFNQEAEELRYRLRQVQAAQQTYYETIKAQLMEKGVEPISTIES